MATVIDDTTGEEVEVVQVHAVAISANQATAGTTITRAQAKRIEEAMANAVRYCYQIGNTDPEFVRGKMQEARAAIKRKFAEEAIEAEKERIAAEQGNLAR